MLYYAWRHARIDHSRLELNTCQRLAMLDLSTASTKPVPHNQSSLPHLLQATTLRLSNSCDLLPPLLMPRLRHLVIRRRAPRSSFPSSLSQLAPTQLTLEQADNELLRALASTSWASVRTLRILPLVWDNTTSPAALSSLLARMPRVSHIAIECVASSSSSSPTMHPISTESLRIPQSVSRLVLVCSDTTGHARARALLPHPHLPSSSQHNWPSPAVLRLHACSPADLLLDSLAAAVPVSSRAYVYHAASHSAATATHAIATTRIRIHLSASASLKLHSTFTPSPALSLSSVPPPSSLHTAKWAQCAPTPLHHLPTPILPTPMSV
ncbi:hypothetical protein RI367_006810 [Sorochytrium milnesiophthora]